MMGRECLWTKFELEGNKGKQADGSALTREAKLGCVFTQTGTDEKGFAVRDPDSTSFVGAIETSEELAGESTPKHCDEDSGAHNVWSF